MRLKKGDRVEVMNKEASSGSWSCVEIVSGNGHTYSVKYCSFLVAGEEAVGRVPRRAIRPCPPAAEEPNVWAAGDLAEVYHNFSWKQAKIMKIVDTDCFIVRLLGSPVDVMVSQSHLRTRQAWEDGKWFVLGKVPKVSRSFSRKRKTRESINPEVAQSKVLSLRLPKRGLPIDSSKFGVHETPTQKRKVTEKDAGYLTNDGWLSQDLNNVRLNLPIPNGNSKVSTGEIEVRGCNLNSGSPFHPRTDSCASSVGSTSSTGDFSKVPFISVLHCSKNVEGKDYCSDAESSTEREPEEGHSCSNQEVLDGSHRSELTAFRSFIRALYVSGPLSWEDEGRLTNIRSGLHISNDEYLIELRNLISANKKTFL